MEIQIGVSLKMDKVVEDGSMSEHRHIRIPKAYREKAELRVGDFLYLRTRLGRLEAFQILEAFKEDADRDPMRAYITSRANMKLFIRNRNTSEISKVENIMLGCDPEAILVDVRNGHVMAAHRFLKKYGEVGHDGLLLEFRPTPSVNAGDVCFTLWQLIQKARTILNEHVEGNSAMIWGCSAYGHLTAGFHLHYGLPSGLLAGKRGTPRVARLMTSAFDYYVGVPSIIPEGNEDSGRRTVKFMNYGKPGGFRLNSRTFEFRLPGGSNLRHPMLARGLMSLGAVVAEDVASRINTCTDCFSNLNEMSDDSDLKELYPNIPDTHTAFDIICNPDIGLAVSHLEMIKKDVRQMVGYEKRAKDVEDYFACLDNRVDFGNNIEQNWGGFYATEQQEQMVFSQQS